MKATLLEAKASVVVVRGTKSPPPSWLGGAELVGPQPGQLHPQAGQGDAWTTPSPSTVRLATTIATFTASPRNGAAGATAARATTWRWSCIVRSNVAGCPSGRKRTSGV